MKKFVIDMLIAMLIIASCTESSKDKIVKSVVNDGETIKIFLEKDIDKNEKINLDSLIESMDYITPQLTDESIIGEYDKIIVCDDRFFIMENSINNKSVFVFDLNGKYLSKVNSVRQGPGEYITIHDFYYDSKNQLIGILSQSQILRYELNGTFKDKINLRKYAIKEIAYANEHVYAYCQPQCKSINCYSVLVLDEKFNPIYEDYPLPKNLINFPFFFEKRSLYSNENNVYFNAINNDTIYRVKDNYMCAEFVIDFGKYKFPNEYFKNLVKEGDKSIKKLGQLYSSKYVLFGIKNYLISDNYVYVSFFKDTKIFLSFYSINSNTTKTFASTYFPSTVFLFGEINSLHNNKFYTVIDNEWLEYLKHTEERDNISNLPDDNLRKIRYNKVLKNFNPNNNSIIAVFKLKPY
ncbi:MAG: 6-bladed beta-propeller [Bacteroidales bacterium]|nr:6-bladed beta-propeller [Bacteroidales bacterium]